jgi:hypothetical protein
VRQPSFRLALLQSLRHHAVAPYRLLKVRGEAHAIVETCKPGFLLSWCNSAAQLAADYIPLHDCVTCYLLIFFLHVRIFKSRTREKTVRTIAKMRAVTLSLRAHNLVVPASLSSSSWSPHTVQQIFDSFTHEPPVLARQDVGRQDPWARRARRCIASSPCTHHIDQYGHFRDAVINLLQLHIFLSVRCLLLPCIETTCHITHIHTDDETNPCCPHLHKLTHPNPKVCRPATDQKIQIPH